MIKLNLQPTNPKDMQRLRWNIGGMLAKDSDNLPEEWEKFTYLAHKLLFALVSLPPLASVEYNDLNAVADCLADSCETANDVYDLRVQCGILAFLLCVRRNKRIREERE